MAILFIIKPNVGNVTAPPLSVEVLDLAELEWPSICHFPKKDLRARVLENVFMENGPLIFVGPWQPENFLPKNLFLAIRWHIDYSGWRWNIVWSGMRNQPNAHDTSLEHISSRLWKLWSWNIVNSPHFFFAKHIYFTSLLFKCWRIVRGFIKREVATWY